MKTQIAALVVLLTACGQMPSAPPVATCEGAVFKCALTDEGKSWCVPDGHSMYCTEGFWHSQGQWVDTEFCTWRKSPEDVVLPNECLKVALKCTPGETDICISNQVLGCGADGIAFDKGSCE